MRNLKYFAWLNGFTWFGNSCKKFVKLWDFEKTENLFHGKIGLKFFKVTCPNNLENGMHKSTIRVD